MLLRRFSNEPAETFIGSAPPNTVLKAASGDAIVVRLLPRRNMVLPPPSLVVFAPSSNDGIGRLMPEATRRSAMNWSIEIMPAVPTLS